jgi:membrane protease YdiL (CAAX protease family)
MTASDPENESDEVARRRRRVVAVTGVAGAGLLGRSLSSEPGSRRFYLSGVAVAATWIAGGLSSGPLHLGRGRAENRGAGRSVVTPIALGIAAFGAFYGAARVARRVPALDRWLHSVLRYANDNHSPGALLATTLMNGATEEVFFRGAVFAAVPADRAVVASTGVYVVATAATRNPALIFASAVMGTLFGMQRRASGGIRAPILTHLTWSGLMLRFLPPLFRRPAAADSLGTTDAR